MSFSIISLYYSILQTHTKKNLAKYVKFHQQGLKTGLPGVFQELSKYCILKFLSFNLKIFNIT